MEREARFRVWAWAWQAPIPQEVEKQVAEARAHLVERVAEVDDELAEQFLAEEAVQTEDLRAAIRRATLALKFVPLFMGSAYKNKGVQLLLDGVRDYLPAPSEISNSALVRLNSLKS